MKRVHVLLLCMFLMLSLAGCTKQIQQTVQQPLFEPVKTSPSSVGQEQTEEEPAVTSEPTITVPTWKKMLLSSPQELSFTDNMFLQQGPEGTVLVITQQVVGRDELPYRTNLCVTVFDPVSGTLLGQRDMGENCYILSQIFADKTFCVVSEDGGRYEFFDKQLEYVHAYRRPVDHSGFFSNDKRYFYYADGALKRYVMESGEEECITVADGLPVCAVTQIHPCCDILRLRVQTDPFGLSMATAVFDVENSKLEWLREDYVTINFSESGNLYYLYSDESYCAVYTQTGADAYEMLELPMNSLQSFQPISNGPYLITKMSDEMQSVRLYRFSETPTYADLSALTSLHEPISMLYEPNSNCLFFSVRLSEEQPCRVVVLNLNLLEFQYPVQLNSMEQEKAIDFECIERYFSLQEPVQLRGGLEYLREYADGLETRFDVKILFSGACTEICAGSDFSVQTTDNLSLRYESQLIYHALLQMEQTLAAYPAGFFAQFKQEQDDISGVRFLLVSTIESSYGVVAYEYFSGGWFNIVYDVNYQSAVMANLYHEIWHATEEKMNYVDGVWLDETLWNSFNPEGFSYSEDYESHYNNSSEYVYYTEHAPERVYFIDTYSKTYAKEDRARLMEYAMSYDYFMQQLQYSEAIVKKLTYMAEQIRENFDTQGWGNTVLWEKYLPVKQMTS